MESLEVLPAAPRDAGRVDLIVCKEDGGRRKTPDRVTLSPDAGLPGDAWGRSRARNPDAQLAVMQTAIATLIAGGQPILLFGDNLFLDLDLSAENLPAGSRLQLGSALTVVTPMPHNGCQKFRRRFGDGALRFVSMPEIWPRNLRGIYLRVVGGGEVRPGDAVTVLSRSPAAERV